MKPMVRRFLHLDLVAIIQSSFRISSRNYAKVSANIFTKGKSSTRKSSLNDLLLTMDSKSAHIPTMKAARKAKKENTPKYPAGVITLQVMGSGANGAPTSLYMFADQSRYLFNCGEGSQRLAHEHHMKLGKLEHIFITSKQWDKIGGLPGMALTVQDIGVPVLTLHGPPGLEEIFSATCRFIILRDLHIRASACLEKEFFEDHVMRVDYVPLFSVSTANPDSPSKCDTTAEVKSSEDFPLDEEENNIDYYGHVDGGKRDVEITREDGAKKRKFETSDPSRTAALRNINCSLCYICRPKARQGTLLIDKCVEKGVPPGPLLGQLKSGFNVTLPNGQVVLAADVRSPDCLGPVFIVADCPSEDFLDSLTANPTWSKYQNVDSENDPENMSPQIIVHFTPSKILLHPKYQAWMEAFGPSAQHLLLNDSCHSLGSEAVHRLQHKLHLIDEDIFPLLYEGGERVREAEYVAPDEDILLKRNINPNQKNIIYLTKPELSSELKELQSQIKAPIILGETLLRFQIRPNKGIDSSIVASTCPEEYKRSVLALEDFPQELSKLKEKLQAMESTLEHQDIPRILFLGTGSCIPNKGRNVSGILIQMNDNSRILFDCGEGTYGQLFRFYGPSRIDRVLKEMKAIYISHLHADHHLGLMNILTKRAVAFQKLNVPFEPCILFAPYQIMYWLNVYSKSFENIRPTFKLVANSTLIHDYTGLYAVNNMSEILQGLDLSAIETCSVRHCANSFGVAITHTSGWKICYSGDTQPCDWFVTLGRDSDVCIHEATMEDELVYEARAKQHSTTSEAIGIGEKMGAKFTLLTHFSQRYAKVPKIDDGLQPNVGIAFDSMMVRLSDLPKIPLMYPALKAMFVGDYEEMENKTQKKIRQRLKDEALVASRAAAISATQN